MQHLLEFFNPMMPPMCNPNSIPTALSKESDLLLQQDTTLPGTLGHATILHTILHGVKVFPTQVGILATQWHGCTLSFMHA
jgi:hypothetical protein